jgi:hypothetical protein
MVNEAYTWVVTLSVGGSSIGSSVAGLIVDRPGGVPWAFVLAGSTATIGAIVAVWPGGPIRRAEVRAAERVEDLLAGSTA